MSDNIKLELLSVVIRTLVASTITYFAIKWAVDLIDPTKRRKNSDKAKADKLLKGLGIDRDRIDLTDHELSMACGMIDPCNMADSWSSVAGLDDVITELTETVILPIKHRSQLKQTSSLLRPPKGVLLYGPPGCGKTLLAKAIARDSGLRFMNLDVSVLTDKWYGESQKLCSAVFSLAEKVQPCIIFIDEIDSLLRSRSSYDHEATAMLKAQFMTLWDGLHTSSSSVTVSDSDGSCVIVLGATNRPDDVDSAILRRMPVRFYVPMPGLKQREAILKLILRNESLDPNLDLANVAEKTDSLSGSDLYEVCRYAAVSNIRKLFGDCCDANHLISQSDFDHAVSKFMLTKNVNSYFRPLLTHEPLG